MFTIPFSLLITYSQNWNILYYSIIKESNIQIVRDTQ